MSGAARQVRLKRIDKCFDDTSRSPKDEDEAADDDEAVLPGEAVPAAEEMVGDEETGVEGEEREAVEDHRCRRSGRGAVRGSTQTMARALADTWSG